MKVLARSGAKMSALEALVRDNEALLAGTDEAEAASSQGTKRARISSGDLLGGEFADYAAVELEELADREVARRANSARAQQRKRRMRLVSADANGSWTAAQLGAYRRAVARDAQLERDVTRRTHAITAPIDRPNFGIAAELDRIDETLFDAHDWISNRAAADAAVAAMADETSAAHQRILSLVIADSSSVPPLRGTGRVERVPGDVCDFRFRRSALVTTPILYTTNTVSTVDIGYPLNVVHLVNRIGGTCFNPLCFAAAMWRSSYATHLIFSKGQSVCAGARSFLHARVATEELVLLLKRSGVPATSSNFCTRNVVSTANAGFKIDLMRLHRAYPLHSEYTKSRFPGVVFRIISDSQKIVFIVFNTGKCINTGMRSRCDALLAWRWFHSNILWHFEDRGAAYGAEGLAHDAPHSALDGVAVQTDRVCSVLHQLSVDKFAALQRDAASDLPLVHLDSHKGADAYDVALDQIVEKLENCAADDALQGDELERWLRAQEKATT